MKLETARVVLREFQEEDYPFYCKVETDAHTIRYEADAIPSQEQLNERFNRMLDSIGQEHRIRYIFLVQRKADAVPLGKVLIWQIDRDIDEWEMGWVFHPDHIGRGYASEAARALIDFGFTSLGANRICANCNDANRASERVMQKVGMTKEGILRETRKLQGKWYGSCIYSLLKGEYAPQQM